MQLKRIDSNATLDLGARLLWTDEFEWSPVAQTVATSTTGALLVSVALRQAGRPITLDGVASQAWYSWALCQQLAAWAAVAPLRSPATSRARCRCRGRPSSCPSKRPTRRACTPCPCR